MTYIIFIMIVMVFIIIVEKINADTTESAHEELNSDLLESPEIEFFENELYDDSFESELIKDESREDTLLERDSEADHLYRAKGLKKIFAIISMTILIAVSYYAVPRIIEKKYPNIISRRLHPEIHRIHSKNPDFDVYIKPEATTQLATLEKEGFSVTHRNVINTKEEGTKSLFGDIMEYTIRNPHNQKEIADNLLNRIFNNPEQIQIDMDYALTEKATVVDKLEERPYMITHSKDGSLEMIIAKKHSENNLLKVIKNQYPRKTVILESSPNHLIYQGYFALIPSDEGVLVHKNDKFQIMDHSEDNDREFTNKNYKYSVTIYKEFRYSQTGKNSLIQMIAFEIGDDAIDAVQNMVKEITAAWKTYELNYELKGPHNLRRFKVHTRRNTKYATEVIINEEGNIKSTIYLYGR